MKNIRIDLTNTLSFLTKNEIENYQDIINDNIGKLVNKTGKGDNYLGWVSLPKEITSDSIEEINSCAKSISNNSDFIVVVGIGGSYLGARAVIEALADSFSQLKKSDSPKIIYAGQNISEDYLHELLELLNTHTYSLVVISKSGTTTEPALAFRLLKQHLEEKVGEEEAKNRIVAITDKKKGALKELSNQEGYKTFDIPDNVGGRYSVLTPVGLLPIAAAGFDINQIVRGAQDMQDLCLSEKDIFNNPASLYAAVRNILYKKGKAIEVMANYNPKLTFFAEWWKQLYGESEGKDKKGIFPASVNLTTDLHSLGQYIQDGERTIMETVLSVTNTKFSLKVPSDKQDLDNLNYLANKQIDEVNQKAELGTILAHVDGGVPNLRIEIPEINEYYIGQLIYFFEIACGISGYILDVNPFDQPGVEEYKKNMFALLGKPGFEEETTKINNRINNKEYQRRPLGRLSI